MANQVTFYSIAQDMDKFEFSTKLISQLWRKEQKKPQQEIAIPLWVLCDSQAVLKQMDDLLWSSQQDSFIAHQIIQHYGQFDAKHKCVTISLAMPIPQWDGIVINLSPYAISQFHNNNIIEVIGNLEQEKTAARTRYKQYQKIGFTIKHHSIGN